MDVHKLDRIFKPQRIALVGVTENPKSVSAARCCATWSAPGFRGVGLPGARRRCEAVLGVPCYPDRRQRCPAPPTSP